MRKKAEEDRGRRTPAGQAQSRAKETRKAAADGRSGKGSRRAAMAAAVFMALVIAWFLYVSHYYHASEEVGAFMVSDEEVAVRNFDGGLFLDGSGEESALIFYPGAKVEYTAYLPLLHRIAADGIDCFLVKMPANLAIFGKNRASGIMAEHSYGHWYLSGHSLGGAMAASYAAASGEELDGLILLAAYPTKELPEDLKVLEIYGSEDGVLDRKRLEKGMEYLPGDSVVTEMPGGNHAQFGDYGEQKSDGEARISRQEQQEITAQQIEEFADAE